MKLVSRSRPSYRLVGLVVRRPPRERKTPGLNPACDVGFFRGRVKKLLCPNNTVCCYVQLFFFTCVYRFLYSNTIYHTEQQKSLKSYSKNAIGVKNASKKKKKKKKKKGHFAHIGNEIKICSQNKCHHHLSNVCENSFRMFHSNWVNSDYHSFVWQFEWPSYCETYEMNFHRRWKGDDGIYFGYRFWFHCLYEQNGLFWKLFSRQWRFWNMIKYTFITGLRSDTYKLIFLKLGALLDMIRLFSLIPVWMILTFSQGPRVTVNRELAQ